MNKRIAVIVGHSRLKNGSYTSAQGVCNEYKYNKKLSTYVVKNLRKKGYTVDRIVCPEKKFKSSKEEYNYKIPRLNSVKYDLVVELHLNASEILTANGTEVFYYTNSKEGKKIAVQVQKQLATLFRDRGVKQTNNLYILRDTKAVAILVESFFCTNKSDYKKANYKKVASLISDGISKAL